jgi:pyruvate dehydrogenase E2 component (dihydrolipoyllysine-residue acetyltransferase)
VVVEVVLPMLGITVERGKILEWLKKEGDPVEKGEIIFIVEVEKATTEVESPASGILAKILIPVGVEAPILSVAAIITAPGEALPEKYRAAQPAAAPAATGAAAAAKEVPDAVTEATPKEMPIKPAEAPGVVMAVPAARYLAKERGIDLAGIKGTGPDGIILVKDVEAAAGAAPKEVPVRVSTLARKLAEKEGVPLEKVEGTGVRGRIMRADVSTYAEGTAASGRRLGTKIPMSTVRKVIGRRMSESAFTAPHIYFFSDVWMDSLLEFREKVVSDFEKHFNLRPSVNDFLIKAVALNILDFPMLNGQVKGEEIHIMPDINVGLAVAVEEGLVVPAIAQADRIGLVEIIRQRIDLVERARKGRLTLAEMERGTFTVSSLAQFDITHFTAILNPPQSGILSVGKTDEKLVLVDGQVRVKRMTTFGLSVDHRIIDGAVAADFLQNLKWKLERPAFTFLAL